MQDAARIAQESAPRADLGDMSAGDPRVLVVDDDEVARLIAARFMRKLGYACDEAEDGVQALELVQERPYPLALIDIEMPRMDGLELLERVCEVQLHTRAIIMSGYLDLHRATKAKRLGAISIVPKPLTLSDLKEAVERFETEERYWRHVLLRVRRLREAEDAAGLRRAP